jgi:hypothetical protein
MPIPVGTLVQPSETSDSQSVPVEFGRLPSTRPIRYRKKTNPWPTVILLGGLLAFLALIGIFVRVAGQNQVERVAPPKVARKATRPSPPVRRPKRARVVVTPESTDQADTSEAIDDSSELPLFEPETPEPAEVSPIRSLIEQFDQSGGLCEAFQFLPEDELQYVQLQNFAWQLSRSKSILDEDHANEINANDLPMLTARSKHWVQTLQALVAKAAAEAPSRLVRINDLAKTALEKVSSSNPTTAQIVFYGCVFLRNDSDRHTILKSDRRQIYFSVPAVSGFDSSGDGSYRIIFVETLGASGHKRMFSPGGGLIRVTPASVIYSFAPIGSQGGS